MNRFSALAVSVTVCAWLCWRLAEKFRLVLGSTGVDTLMRDRKIETAGPCRAVVNVRERKNFQNPPSVSGNRLLLQRQKVKIVWFVASVIGSRFSPTIVNWVYYSKPPVVKILSGL